MDWKDDIGKYYGDKRIFRIQFLNDNILTTILIEFVNYLNEFDGIQATFGKHSSINKNGKPEIRFRVEIYYPNDELLFGSFCDMKNRRFISDVYFDSEGLKILVHYRRKGGAFMENRFISSPPIKYVKPDDQKKEKDINKIYRNLVDNYNARDIYCRRLNFVDAFDNNVLCSTLFSLYKEHNIHVKQNNAF